MGIRPHTCPVMSVAGNNVFCLVDSKLVRRMTKYAWALRHSSSADKTSVRFSGKAVLSQTIEVRCRFSI
jgi:hypothetical protein